MMQGNINIVDNLIVQNTPVEKYISNNGYVFFVKREDLACPSPGPPFAKVRGLYRRLVNLKASGVSVVGYIDTNISMAGWGVSYFAKKLGMQAVIYKPTYVDGMNRYSQDEQIKSWKRNGAIIRNIQASRMCVNWYQARKKLLDEFPKAYMLEQGLPFKETIQEVSKQVTGEMKKFRSLVVCIGSGTMTAGILRGLQRQNINLDLYGVLVSPKNKNRIKRKIYHMSGVYPFGFFKVFKGNFFVIDAGYEYTDKETTDCLFPCNPYYDRKAWKWFVDNMHNLKSPVLFWNIGA